MTLSDEFSATADTDRGPVLSLLCLCFALSGVAALIYQIAWTRQFALVFGTSELAIAAVLASYMGGLALGAILIEKRLSSISRPVLWYGALELGIGASALLLVPAGLWLAEHLLIWLVGGQHAPPSANHTGSSLFFLLAASVILLIPTTLMGATLPLLARHAVRDESQIGQRISLLYACNTAGSVAGALLAALLLLPALGLSNTLRIAAAINLLVGLCAAALSRVTAASTNQAGGSLVTNANTASPRESFRLGMSPTWVLPLMLCSGAVSFLHEVLWTRMLGHIVGGSIHAFGIMIASFLAGIAAGGAVVAGFARERDEAARWFAISELLAALAAIAAWLALQRLDPQVGPLPQRLAFGFALLFPLAFAIGMTYPLAVRILTRTPDEAALASARVYGWNTVGAILGALIGGFVILPTLRYEGSVHVAVLASTALAMFAIFALFKPTRMWATVAVLIAATIAILFRPQIPEALLRYSPLRVNGDGELLFYAVGRSATVTTLRQGDQYAVRTNGLPEASVDGVGTAPQMYVEAWMAPLAVLARPHTTNMLIVGLGGGRVVEAVPSVVKDIDVIELEDKVVDANRQIAARRLRDPLDDVRVRVIGNDARGALQLTDKRYDAVVSQPSHPWTAGASHLYTREFMQQVKTHLNPGGVFVQWMNVDFLDEALLRSLLATIYDVYPHVRVYRPAPPTLLFLASDRPIEPERQMEATRAALAAAPDDYARMGIKAVEDLVACWVLDDDSSRALAGAAPLITDDRNRFATDMVYDAGRNITADETGRLLQTYDPLLHTDNFLYRDAAGAKLDWGYLARRAALYAQWDNSVRTRLMQLSTHLRGTDLESYVEAVSLQSRQLADQAQQTRLTGLLQHAGSELLSDAILEQALDAIVAGHATKDVAALSLESSANARLIIQATRLAETNEWGSVSTLDALLAQIPVTSIWFSRAIQLRAEWRTHAFAQHEALNDTQENGARWREYGVEAVRWMDQLNQLQTTSNLMLLRAVGGRMARQPAVIMESINRYAALVMQNRDTLVDEEKSQIVAGLTTLKPLLDALATESSLDRRRLAEVQAAFEQAQRQFDQGPLTPGLR